MNISKTEQHVLAQGGAISFTRGANGKLTSVTCFTRDGHVLGDCTLDMVTRLRKRRFIQSRQGRPYRITRLGSRCVLAQLDNR